MAEFWKIFGEKFWVENSDVPINRHRQESAFFKGIGIGKNRHWLRQNLPIPKPILCRLHYKSCTACSALPINYLKYTNKLSQIVISVCLSFVLTISTKII